MNPVARQWFWDQTLPLHWLLVDDVTDDLSVPVAVCTDIDGLFVDPASEAGPVTLIGCLPEPALSRALVALARGAGNHGGALHRRMIQASIFSVADSGTATDMRGPFLSASVSGVRPSARGDGLIDVTFDSAFDEPLPAGARQIWDLWRSGRPAEVDRWTGYHRELRQQWSMAALFHHRREMPDRPPGRTFHLHGRHITDPEGFYCAIGEAVNGPGGYFGGGPTALHDCLLGRWGARPPFTLIWHESAVARAHLGTGHRPGTGEPDETLEQILRWLAEDGVTDELR